MQFQAKVTYWDSEVPVIRTAGDVFEKPDGYENKHAVALEEKPKRTRSTRSKAPETTDAEE